MYASLYVINDRVVPIFGDLSTAYFWVPFLLGPVIRAETEQGGTRLRPKIRSGMSFLCKVVRIPDENVLKG